MLGFEIEIDLAVTDAAGDLIDGDTDLARSTTVPSFRLVSDSRSLTEHTDYSNIEFVTDAVSVVGPDSATGPAAVARQLAEVERIRDALYLANAAPLARADATLTMAPAGAGARLAPDLGYDESDTLLVHYSTGVPLGGLPQFFDELRAAAPVGRLGPKDHPSLIRDRFSLHQARSFAADEMAKFHQRPHAPADGSLESRKLDGFLQLAYMQVCALADHLDYDGKGGNIKNLTAVLCRSAFADVVPLLGAEAVAHLTSRCADPYPLLDTLARHQEQAEPGWTRAHAFHEDGVRQSGSLAPITLLDFSVSVFTGNPRVSPQRIFGGMREIAPHAEHGKTLVPMELRSLGEEAKRWDDVRDELAEICRWSEEAYRLG